MIISDAVKVYPILLKHSKLVSFQEMVPEENILCQLANLRNIETFALEHAIGIYKNEGQVWESAGPGGGHRGVSPRLRHIRPHEAQGVRRGWHRLLPQGDARHRH